jgi:nucleotide-binding universal stress UspA family protein
MVRIERILFPCDLTDNSLKVLPYVLSLAEKYDSKVYLLYVDDLYVWGGNFIPHPSLTVLQKESLEAARKAMDRVCEERLQGCPNFQRKVVSGDPVSEIVKEIEAEGINMVVMGTHGRRGLEERIFGSVAENVVKKSPVPVLVINSHKVK